MLAVKRNGGSKASLFCEQQQQQLFLWKNATQASLVPYGSTHAKDMELLFEYVSKYFGIPAPQNWPLNEHNLYISYW